MVCICPDVDNIVYIKGNYKKQNTNTFNIRLHESNHSSADIYSDFLDPKNLW